MPLEHTYIHTNTHTPVSDGLLFSDQLKTTLPPAKNSKMIAVLLLYEKPPEEEELFSFLCLPARCEFLFTILLQDTPMQVLFLRFVSMVYCMQATYAKCSWFCRDFY